MVSWSQFAIIAVSAASCAATAAVAGVAVFYFANGYFAAKGRSKTVQKKRVLGLYNLGNTCFANALLQSLAACPTFLNWLGDLGDLPSTCPFLIELRNVLKGLNESTEGAAASADGVLAALGQHRWNITPYMEQDLFELLNVFITTWEEEIEGTLAAKTSSLADVSDSEMAAGCHRLAILSRIKDLVDAQHHYRAPCTGLIGTQMNCRSCRLKYARHDRYCSLDLVLPKTTRFMEISIETCLRKYFAQETLYNYKCDRCKDEPWSKNVFYKQQGISKLPECLILRIQRVGISPNGNAFKHVDHVRFDEHLNVREFLFYGQRNAAPVIKGGSDASLGRNVFSENAVDYTQLTLVSPHSRPHIYRLRAVVVHIGQPESGHFVTYRRGANQLEDHWYYTSDLEVRKASFAEIAKREAYMLFYERLSFFK